jgi:hypothetical protein
MRATVLMDNDVIDKDERRRFFSYVWRSDQSKNILLARSFAHTYFVYDVL